MKKRETPAELARFLEKDASALKNKKIDLDASIWGDDHPDIGTYAVRFPKSPWSLFKNQGIETEEHPDHVPFASLHHEDGAMDCFLAFNCASKGVDVWDAMNGEGFFVVSKSLADFKKRLT